MKNIFNTIIIFAVLLLGSFQLAVAQIGQFQNPNPAIIKITRAGQLGDTLNVWGDVRVTGRYLVPRSTNLVEMISIAKGPAGTGGAGQRDLSNQAKVEVYISRYNERLDEFRIKTFDLKLNEPFPEEMKNFPLQNGDVITVKVEEEPSFFDYFSVIAPIITLGFTTYLFVNQL